MIKNKPHPSQDEFIYFYSTFRLSARYDHEVPFRSHFLLQASEAVDKEECELDADDLMMQALDAGAEDFSEEEDSFEILTDPNDFSEVRLALEEAGIPMASAEVTMIPQTWVTLDNEEDIKNIQKTLDLLEDDDDVQEVYHNWEEA